MCAVHHPTLGARSDMRRRQRPPSARRYGMRPRPGNSTLACRALIFLESGRRCSHARRAPSGAVWRSLRCGGQRPVPAASPDAIRLRLPSRSATPDCSKAAGLLAERVWIDLVGLDEATANACLRGRSPARYAAMPAGPAAFPAHQPGRRGSAGGSDRAAARVKPAVPPQPSVHWPGRRARSLTGE